MILAHFKHDQWWITATTAKKDYVNIGFTLKTKRLASYLSGTKY
jgi:hypothetical protein